MDSFSTVTFITGGTLNTTPPSDVRLKTYQTPKHHSRWTPFTHNTHAPVWIPVPAWRQLLRLITVGQSSLRPGSHPYLLLPRLERGSRRFFPGPPRLPVPVLVLPVLPWLKPRRRVPVPVKRKKLWQKRPTLQPQGLRPRQQLPNRQPLRLPQAARRCCPVRATSGWTTTGKASSRSPRRRARSELKESWS